MCLFSTKWFLDILEMNEWRNKMAQEGGNYIYGYIKRSKLLLKLSRKYPVVLSSEVLRSHDSQGCRKGGKDPLALQFTAYDFRKCLMNRAYKLPWDTQKCVFACYVRTREESLRTKKIVLSCSKVVINVARHRRAQL